MSCRLELRRFLDPRGATSAVARPIRDAVNIPLEQIRSRAHELPPPTAEIEVAADLDLFQRTRDVLASLGRRCLHATDHYFEKMTPRSFGRLWRPSKVVETAAGVRPPGRALDLGCGTGRDAVYLAAAGWCVTAVDRLPDAIDRGRLIAFSAGIDATAIDWICANAADTLQQLNAPFDLIVFVRYFNRDVLEQALPMIAPSGSIVLEVFAEQKSFSHRRPATSESELRQMLSGFGLQRIETAEDERGRSVLRAWAQFP